MKIEDGIGRRRQQERHIPHRDETHPAVLPGMGGREYPALDAA